MAVAKQKPSIVHSFRPKRRKKKIGIKSGRKTGATLDADFFSSLDQDYPTKITQKSLELQDLDENLLAASICRDSFYAFVKEFWAEVSNEVPVWNWHIKYLCDFLQTIVLRAKERLPCEGDVIINIPPGTTKSTVVSIMLEAWTWIPMPDAAFMCISHTHNLAMDLARKSRDVIMSDKYKAYFPGIRLREDQNTKGLFINSKKGLRYSCSSLGSNIGKHFHFIIIDDPIDPQAALSETEMPSINRWLSESLDTRKIDKLNTVTVLVMQRLHEDDPTADKCNRDPKVRRFVLPADITDPEVAENLFPPELKKYYVDNLLDPIRLNQDHLDQYRAKGDYYFSGQFDQKPNPTGGGLFKTNNIQIREAVPNNWKKLVRYWDKAATHQGGAFSVGVLMGRDEYDKFWILDVQRGQWDSSVRDQVILDTAMLDGRKTMVGLEQEGGSGGKESAERSVKALAGFSAHIIVPRGDKVLRADPFSSQVNGGNVYMKKAPWNRTYIDEMKHFPLSKYKDQIDASAGAFTLHTKPIYQVGPLAFTPSNGVILKPKYLPTPKLVGISGYTDVIRGMVEVRNGKLVRTAEGVRQRDPDYSG